MKKKLKVLKLPKCTQVNHKALRHFVVNISFSKVYLNLDGMVEWNTNASCTVVLLKDWFFLSASKLFRPDLNYFKIRIPIKRLILVLLPDILGLLYLLGGLHPLEDEVSLPLVLDLLHALSKQQIYKWIKTKRWTSL